MGITNDFIATGTQLKVEKPTKGCVVTLCDQLEGPIVKFKDGSVKKIESYEEAKSIYDEIDEIIYLGDILFPLGDVINRNARLVKSGYVEEWWYLELKKAGGNIEDYFDVGLEKAMELSIKYKIPLHPQHIFYWTQISYEQFLGFIDWFQNSRVNDGKLVFPYNSSEKERFKTGKRALELLGVNHSVGIENVILEKNESKKLLVNLGFDDSHKDFNFEHRFEEHKSVLEIVNELALFKIKDKSGEFIGTRMGRPEKAKLRKLTGSPHILFPIGDEGGRLRSINEAVHIGYVKGDFPFNYCKNCKKESIYRVCEKCKEKTEKKFYCRLCRREIESFCEIHSIKNRFKNTRIDMNHYFEKARETLNILKTEIPNLIKGVRGTSSEDHDLEPLVKGILRAKYNLCVNKDGTIRYDMTEIPVTHFKPLEIGVSVRKLRELGYEKDCYGNILEHEDQILELKPHDVLIPCNNKSL